MFVIAIGVLAYGGSFVNEKLIDFKQRNLSPEKEGSKNSGGEILLKVKVFKKEGGWGYDIYRNNKLYIHQPYIPAISGNHTFSHLKIITAFNYPLK